MCPRYAIFKFNFDIFILKVVSVSRATWATSVPILAFLWRLCSRLRPDVRDRQTDVRRVSSLSTSAMGAGHNVNNAYTPSTTTRVVYSCGFCKRTHTRLGRTVLPNVMCSLSNVLCSLSSYGIVGSTHTVTTLRVTATAVNHLRECVRSLGTGVGVRLKAGDKY